MERFLQLHISVRFYLSLFVLSSIALSAHCAPLVIAAAFTVTPIHLRPVTQIIRRHHAVAGGSSLSGGQASPRRCSGRQHNSSGTDRILY